MDIDIARSEFQALILSVAAQHPDPSPEELVPYISAATAASKRRDYFTVVLIPVIERELARKGTGTGEPSPLGGLADHFDAQAHTNAAVREAVEGKIEARRPGSPQSDRKTGPVRSQSAVDCNGCAKIPQAQRADLRFCRQPSQLDLANAQYDVVENRSVTGHYNLP